MPETRGFHSEFGFGKAKSHFNLPPTHVDEDNMPSMIDGVELFVGKQI